MKTVLSTAGSSLNVKTAAKMALAVAFLIAASKASFAIGPVPLSFQTLAVAVVGAALGARLGAASVLSYIALGLFGLPVFATPLCGPAVLAGPTAGYIVAFPMAAALAGFLAQRGWSGARIVKSFASQLAANLFICTVGALWLSASLGIAKGFTLGFAPFVIGSVLKAVLGAAILKALSMSGKK